MGLLFMRASELKRNVKRTGSYFFDKKSMDFFGDRMANYGVRKVVITNCQHLDIECYELHRKRAVKHGLQASHYFNVNDFSAVYVK